MPNKPSSNHVIRGVLWYTQNLRIPNTRFDENGKWPVTVIQLDDEALEEIERAGLSFKVKTGKGKEEHFGKYIKLDRHVVRYDGTKNPPPQVVDQNAEAFGGNIGFGSIGNVAFRSYPTKMKRGHDLEGVQIVKLIPFEKKLFNPVEAAAEDNPFDGA